MTKKLHLTISSGSDQNGEWHSASACHLDENSDADWNGTRQRDQVTCKRCLTQMAKPKATSTIGLHKECPMLFSGPMVRAILEGRKTVTRRPLKGHHIPHQISSEDEEHRWMATVQNHPRWGFCAFGATEAECVAELAMYGGCPYGNRGDRLWVRETFALLGNEDGVCIDWNNQLVKGDERAAARIFRASCAVGEYGLWQVPDKAEWKPDTDGLQYEGAWRPSIHMPRWASRILLEITAVRVERLHQMKTADYQAEGCHGGHGSIPGYIYNATPCEHFHHVWNSTGGDWDANPWVWVVEFKQVTP